MKLIRFGPRGEERPGILGPDGVRRDASAFAEDWTGAFFEGGGIERLREAALDALPAVADTERLGSPVARPGKILCIGKNYADHAAETGAKPPKEPVAFMKAPNTVVGPYDNIEIPRGSEKTDWEVELGVILGREARYLESEAEAGACIAGYLIAHDVSERAFQIERGGQWTKGKSCDTFCPLGPWLVTPDEIEDVGHLALTTDVNGERRQDGNTKDMLFGVRHLIWYLSQMMTLEAGDLISTGTPSGVGLGMDPPTYLKAGDVVELAVTGLGTQRSTCVPAGG